MDNIPIHSTVNIHPLRELDSVNQMLLAAGITPVSTVDSTIDNNKNIDVIQAKQLLNFTSREVQAEGWYFNTEHNCTLLPDDVSGSIAIPANAIRVDIAPFSDPSGYSSFDVIRRGNYLYDMNSHSFDFGGRSVIATITYFLPFEEVPDTARIYITIKAARRFRMNVTGGDDNASLLSREDEARARAALMREHVTGIDRGFTDATRRNTLTGITSIGRVLQRRL